MEVFNGSAATVVGSRGYEAVFERQLSLVSWGLVGQQRVEEARAHVVGMGALGCPAALYLARAGFGTIHLWDHDQVEPGNLHRQILYGPGHVGQSKALVSATVLQTQCPWTNFVHHTEKFPQDPGITASHIKSGDVILDCTDSFASRFAVNDLARLMRLDLVSASIAGFTGQLMVFPFSQPPSPNRPCLHCLYPEAPLDPAQLSCAEHGVLGAGAGIMGSIQALTVLNMIVGPVSLPGATVRTFRLNTMDSYDMKYSRREDCACQGDQPMDAVPYALSHGLTQGVHRGFQAAGVKEEKGGVPELIVLDLRESAEQRPGDRELFPQALNLPYAHALRAVELLNSHKRYLLLCEKGIKSAHLAQRMKAVGFSRVSHLPGGFSILRRGFDL